MARSTTRRTLLATTIIAGALFASPALAQSTGTPAPRPAPTAEEDDKATIIVTGSILRRTDSETPSPVTVVTADAIDQRGQSTVQDALQLLSSNNGPALTNSFTANGAFAAGASAVSLRGLSTNSTLVLFDGMRAAYYPLADDGSRNFVDLNTIPDDIIDRVEILRDGASSSYGADAIAGVVNLITKREIQGINGRAEGGVSSRGDAATYRLGLSAGYGDLDDQGFNAYLSGFYYQSKGLKASERPYPYNSDNLTGIGGADNRINASTGGFSALSTAANFLVRPATLNPGSTTVTTVVPGSSFQNLGTGCGPGTAYTLTAAERAAVPIAPATVCQYDFTNLYGTITPNIQRFGLSGRVTAKLGDTTEGYFEVNFLQSKVDYTGFPATVYGNANTGIVYPRFSTSSGAAINAPGSFVLFLPVFVCPERVNCATSANRRLNPNNPFAAAGQVARLIGRDQTQTTYNETRNRAYRAAFGISGQFNDNIGFKVDATAMHTDLRRTQKNYVFIQRLLDVINDGTYNFVNPSLNSQAINDYLKPVNQNDATSDLAQLQAVVTATLGRLPGGDVQLGVGGSVFYEAVDAPSGNPDYNGPTQRFFTLNAFGTKGNRTVTSAFGELNAPIFDQLEVNLSGRYDRYSSGQSAFSPKAGVKFTPIRQVALRATYSKGFRIPSFGEANALPTTGFVSNTAAVFNNAYLAQYTVAGNTAGAGGTFANCTTANFTSAACAVYIRSGSYGQTTLASPNLNPEKSRSITAGVVFEPIPQVSLTIDYYNIKKTGVITQPSNAPALIAYYANQPIPAGYTVIADAPDPNNPTARPRVAFVQSQLINANENLVEGVDFTATGRFSIGGVKFVSSLDAGIILKLTTTFPDGSVERYDGTLGNYNLTAGSGTPKWRASFQQSVETGPLRVTGTGYYVSGYDLSAQDQGTGYKDCGLGPSSDGGCRVKSYITFDLNAQVKINDKFTFYATVNNLFDRLPPIDEITYGAHLYNPVQAGNGILGRYFKAGVKFGL
jgi:iron complex outermembrane recepter protein